MIQKPIYNAHNIMHNQKKINLGFQVIEHPFLLENMEYYKIRRILNREQQAIVKEIAMKKRMDINKPLYLFLTGGEGTRKKNYSKSNISSAYTNL